MARLSISSAPLTPVTRQNEALTDLTRLLSRLQQTVLRADAERERRLRTSEYERKRVTTNIDHARTLLTRLEQEALGTKFQMPRQDLVRDLDAKRELLGQLTERMHDLEEIAAHGSLVEDGGAEGGEEDGSGNWGEGGEDSDSEEEDILAEIIATPSESMDSRSTDVVSQDEEEEVEQEQDIPPLSRQELASTVASRQEEEGREESQNAQQAQATTRSPAETTPPSTLRSRTTATQPVPPQPQQPAQPSSSDPSTATTTSRDLLLGGRSSSSKATTALSTTEAVLDHQRHEQDFLSESILKMATDLKASSLSFSDALGSDKDVVSRAGQGLDRNERGLEAAARRMGALVRATEGKGWIGRMILYAWVYGLMLVLVVVVFGLPKLRF